MASSSERPHLLCDDTRPMCPRCNHPIRRITSGVGTSYATCEERFERPLPGGGVVRDRCGQHVHILGAPEGVCIVTPISKAEYDALTQGNYRPAKALYRELGVVIAHDGVNGHLIPEEPCVRCKEATKTTDLYGSVCRWCRDRVARPRKAS